MNHRDPELTTIDPARVGLLILAGGRGRRMGGIDKGLMPIAGRPAIEHLLRRVQHHPGPVLISANRNLECYARYGHPVLTDGRDDYPGPLAGMLTGLEALDGSHLLTLPVDAPLVAPDYPARMIGALRNTRARAAVARLDGRMEPVFALLARTLAPALRRRLDTGRYRASEWLASVEAVPVDFSDHPEQFINLNREQDLARLRTWMEDEDETGTQP